MTTIRNRKYLRKYIDYVTPADRMRHSAGWYRSPLWPALLLLVLLAAYAAPDLTTPINIYGFEFNLAGLSYILLIAALLLWAIRETWRRYIRPVIYGIMHDDDSLIIPERGEPTEEADRNYAGWKPRGFK